MSIRALAILAFVLAGCGASAQQKALHATYLGVTAAEAGFVAWDEQHQTQIVANATSFDAGTAALQSYRLQRDPVLQGFILVYQLLYIAASDTTEEKLRAAAAAATKLYRLIEAIKGPMTWTRRQPGEVRIARVRKLGTWSPALVADPSPPMPVAARFGGIGMCQLGGGAP